MLHGSTHSDGVGGQLQRVIHNQLAALDGLEEGVMQVPRDARALADALFQPHVELPRHLTEPEVIKRSEQCQKCGHARPAEPPCLPEYRIHITRSRSLRIHPTPISVTC